MPKVLIAPMTLAGLQGPFLTALQDAGFELVYPNLGHQLNEDELLRALDGISASLAGSEELFRPTRPKLLEDTDDVISEAVERRAEPVEREHVNHLDLTDSELVQVAEKVR